MARVTVDVPEIFAKIFGDVIKKDPKMVVHKPRVKILIDKPANQLRAYITFEEGVDLEEMCVQARSTLDELIKTKPKPPEKTIPSAKKA